MGFALYGKTVLKENRMSFKLWSSVSDYWASRKEAIVAIAGDDMIALSHRIEALQRIDAGENHEDVLHDFKAKVLEGIENCHEGMGK